MVLITGAAGFIGFHISRYFLKKNIKVVGVDIINNYYDTNLKKKRLSELKKNKNFFFKKTDISNEKEIKKIFTRFKFKEVIHLAAQAGVRYSLENPKSYITSNLVGYFHILNECRLHKIKHLIYASSSSIYGINKKKPFSEKDEANHPMQIYAATKRANELMAHSYSALYNLKTTGLRFFTVYGPWGRPDMAVYKFTDKIYKKKYLYLYNFGKNFRDFTYVDDVVEAIYKIYKNKKVFKNKGKNLNAGNSIFPYQVFNIGNNKKVSTTRLIKLLEKYTGKEAKIKKIKQQLGDVLNTHASTAKTYKYFNFRPRTSIEEGIKNFVIWYKDYNKIK